MLPYSRNIKLRSAVTVFLGLEACLQHGVFGYGGLNGVTAIFITWPEVAACTKCTHSRVVRFRLEGSLVERLLCYVMMTTCDADTWCRWTERQSTSSVPTDAKHCRVLDNHWRDWSSDCSDVGYCSLLCLSTVQDVQLSVGDSAWRVHHVAQEGLFTSLCLVFFL